MSICKFDGSHRFLSNFYAIPGGIVPTDCFNYPTVEHAFQAWKTTDFAARREFTRVDLTAADAKRLGRKLVLRPDWEAVKQTVMYCLLHLKFENPDLRAKLLATGDAELIEGNTWGDTYWGVCRGNGSNHLGKLLMRVRKEIREENATEEAVLTD